MLLFFYLNYIFMSFFFYERLQIETVKTVIDDDASRNCTSLTFKDLPKSLIKGHGKLSYGVLQEMIWYVHVDWVSWNQDVMFQSRSKQTLRNFAWLLAKVNHTLNFDFSSFPASRPDIVTKVLGESRAKAKTMEQSYVDLLKAKGVGCSERERERERWGEVGTDHDTNRIGFQTESLLCKF